MVSPSRCSNHSRPVWLRLTVTALLLGLASACDNRVCATGILAGLEIEVFDAASDAPLAAEALAIVYAGAEVVDSVRHQGPATPPPRFLVSSRVGPGSYRVRVEHVGYVPWEQANVRVERGPSCGPGIETTRLQAPLVLDTGSGGQ